MAVKKGKPVLNRRMVYIEESVAVLIDEKVRVRSERSRSHLVLVLVRCEIMLTLDLVVSYARVENPFTYFSL